MSARPGRIKAIIETKFDDRDPGLTRSKEFVEKVDEIWNLVREEAIKAQEKAQDKKVQDEKPGS
jgi:NitT/TauT family transport system ATP-binding protein